MKKNDYPLISCLCVTRLKPNLLNRAINCFLHQTYPNKELVVVYDDDDELTKKKIKSIKYSNVVFYEINKMNMTLGDIRNYAIEKSKGDYVCQWDDDDWYHVDRIKCQYEIMSKTNYPACILTQWLLFDSVTDKAYVSNSRMWEGSILCEKKVIQGIKYERLNKGEDTIVIETLFKENKICLINDYEKLCIYIYHGKNTWDYGHWKEIFDCSFELSSADSAEIKDILEKHKNVERGSYLLDGLIEPYNFPKKDTFVL